MGKSRVAQAIAAAELSAGQSFTQNFSLEGDGVLRRIDVQILLDRQARSLKNFHWALVKIDSDGKKFLLSENYIDLSKTCGDDYVSIPINSPYIHETRQFALSLHVPADAPGKVSLKIPLYQVSKNKKMQAQNSDGKRRIDSEFSGDLKGFIYFQRENQASGLIAGRIEEKK